MKDDGEGIDVSLTASPPGVFLFSQMFWRHPQLTWTAQDVIVSSNGTVVKYMYMIPIWITYKPTYFTCCYLQSGVILMYVFV